MQVEEIFFPLELQRARGTLAPNEMMTASIGTHSLYGIDLAGAQKYLGRKISRSSEVIEW